MTCKISIINYIINYIFYLFEGPAREVRKWSALYHLWHARKKEKSIFSKSSYQGNTVEELGFLPTSKELDLERPKLDLTEGQEDVITLNGLDDDGNILLIKIGLKAGRKAAVWLQWRQDNDVYHLANQEIFGQVLINVEASTEDSFRAGGLTLSMIEPMRSWRIVFNGLLKSRESDKVVHARINAM